MTRAIELSRWDSRSQAHVVARSRPLESLPTTAKASPVKTQLNLFAIEEELLNKLHLALPFLPFADLDPVCPSLRRLRKLQSTESWCVLLRGYHSVCHVC